MTASEPKYFYRPALQGLPYGALTMDATGCGVGAQQGGADPLLEASLGVPDSRSAGVRQRGNAFIRLPRPWRRRQNALAGG